MSDYYQILKVSRKATDQELKNSYRELAKIHHPDKNLGDKEATAKFQALTEAYETLRDSRRRQLYDLGQTAQPKREGAQTGFAPGGFGGISITQVPTGFKSWSEFWDKMFSDVRGNLNAEPTKEELFNMVMEQAETTAGVKFRDRNYQGPDEVISETFGDVLNKNLEIFKKTPWSQEGTIEYVLERAQKETFLMGAKLPTKEVELLEGLIQVNQTEGNNSWIVADGSYKITKQDGSVSVLIKPYDFRDKGSQQPPQVFDHTLRRGLFGGNGAWRNVNPGEYVDAKSFGDLPLPGDKNPGGPIKGSILGSRGNDTYYKRILSYQRLAYSIVSLKDNWNEDDFSTLRKSWESIKRGPSSGQDLQDFKTPQDLGRRIDEGLKTTSPEGSIHNPEGEPGFRR